MKKVDVIADHSMIGSMSYDLCISCLYDEMKESAPQIPRLAGNQTAMS